jgi:hypothetical protein
MKFLNYSYKSSLEEIKSCFDGYYAYLESVKNKLPLNTYEFAVSDWHYNFEDPRSPHDAWIEKFLMVEKSGEPQTKSVDMELQLLGAYHNGNIVINYSEVSSYKIEWNFFQEQEINSKKPWHGDWIIDEISLSDSGKVIHEIEFRFDGHWIIECQEINYNWLPIKA